MKYFKTLNVPADTVEKIQNDKQLNPLTVVFDNGCQGQLRVVADVGITLTITKNDQELGQYTSSSFDIIQDFIVSHGQDLYQLTVTRGARTSLKPEDIQKYIKNRGVRCPFCESRDLHSAKAQNTDDGIIQQVTCCSCEAEWVDFYRLETIHDHTPPQRNVICSD